MNNVADVVALGFMECMKEIKDDERNDDVMQMVKECYEEMNVPFLDENIDRAHRSGKIYLDKNTGKKVKSIIVRFNSWKSRQHFYNARPKHFTNSKRKPGQHYLVYRLISLEGDIYY